MNMKDQIKTQQLCSVVNLIGMELGCNQTIKGIIVKFVLLVGYYK